MIYDAYGQRVNFADSFTAKDFAAHEYKSFLAHGILFRQDIVAPTNGEYFLRVGIFDGSSDRAGAVEIPLSSIHPRPVARLSRN